MEDSNVTSKERKAIYDLFSIIDKRDKPITVRILKNREKHGVIETKFNYDLFDTGDNQ